jgi:putative inorganic carbon (hco3(-)) transporter
VSTQVRLRPAHEVTTPPAPALAAGAAALALGVVAAYSPKTALEALLAAALFAVAIYRLDLGLAVFIFLTFPEHLPGAFGAEVTLAKPVGVVIAVAWVAIVAGRLETVPLLPRDRPLLFWAAIGFLALGTVSVLWAQDGAQTFYILSRLSQAVLLALIAYTAAATRSGFRTVVWGYLVASAVTSVYTIGTGAYGANGRLGGLFDPNYFAAILIPAVAVAVFLILAEGGSRRSRVAAMAIAVIDLAAFALTQSRGGLVGLAVALVACVALAGRTRPRVLALVLVLFAAGLGYYAIARPAHVVSGTSSGRAGEWRVALRMFDNHPLRGVGLGNFTVVEPSYSDQTLNLNRVGLILNQPHRTHNTYLEVAAELGIPGLLLFLLVMGAAVRSAWRGLARVARTASSVEPAVRGLLAGAIGMFSAYVFISAQWEKQLWLVFALLAAVPALARPSGDREEPVRVSRADDA